MTPRRPVVLVLTSHYLPGYKAGGPIRTIRNLVAALGDEFDFRIVTSDHDFGERRTFPSIATGGWNRVEAASVFYADRPALREAILVYSREIAFSAAEVYARAAEARGAWDARLEALIVDALLRDDLDDSVLAIGQDLVIDQIVAFPRDGPFQILPDIVRRGLADVLKSLVQEDGPRPAIEVAGHGISIADRPGPGAEFQDDRIVVVDQHA